MLLARNSKFPSGSFHRLLLKMKRSLELTPTANETNAKDVASKSVKVTKREGKLIVKNNFIIIV